MNLVQAQLDFSPPLDPLSSRLERAFREWLDSKDGQTVFLEVLTRARMLKSRGFDHYGIAPIFESIRYDRSVALGKDAEAWRLNNNHRSRLARRVMEEPGLEGFFETRELREEP